MKDVTFSNGMVIPKGAFVIAASHATHHDDALYANAASFDPFRFSRMREVEGEGMKYQLVNTSPEYVSFGHGRHAWCVLDDVQECLTACADSAMPNSPGRFFAANELKAMLAYIVVNYDLKIAGDGERPPNMYIAANVVPSPKGEILFRKRKVTRTA